MVKFLFFSFNKQERNGGRESMREGERELSEQLNGTLGEITKGEEKDVVPVGGVQTDGGYVSFLAVRGGL